ncbi:hypothetical protein DL96DRAFT_1720156 [Flagelloscypha sp. PMI_526]|nr:hypothetical protein DL96DRAFT_1720156 [Flagelloscypha sp. PMI_526]
MTCAPKITKLIILRHLAATLSPDAAQVESLSRFAIWKRSTVPAPSRTHIAQPQDNRRKLERTYQPRLTRTYAHTPTSSSFKLTTVETDGVYGLKQLPCSHATSNPAEPIPQVVPTAATIFGRALTPNPLLLLYIHAPAAFARSVQTKAVK